MNRHKNVLDLSSEELKEFFLQSENYCNVNLPPYFQFNRLLKELDTFLQDKKKNEYREKDKIRNIENVNNTIYHSKDGQYQWRPLQLIHPVIYLELVNIISNPTNWNIIKQRFNLFRQNPKILCTSVPIQRRKGENNTAASVLNWWDKMEQGVLAESLNFSYIYTTDIADFYPSIYTHTISWAIYGKEEAKKNRSKDLFGNKIDFLMQDMHHGQTNGIPQGSTLTDFIAEIVLGYADLVLSEKLAKENVTNYKIFRYRDDYKILVDTPEDGEAILKALTEVLLDLNLKLNTSKTKKNEDIITGAIKTDKLQWIMQSHFMDLLNPSYQCRLENKEWQFLNNQKTLLGIYQFSKQHPNSGTVARLLSIYSQKIDLSEKDNIFVLISILTSIMMNNPRTYPQGSALLSLFLMKLPKNERLRILKNIQAKFEQKPHIDLLDIWFQRISWKIDPSCPYAPALCQSVEFPQNTLWNMDWLKENVRSIFCKNSIVDREILNEMPPYIKIEEVDPFVGYQY